MLKIMPRIPIQKMVNGEIMPMKKIQTPKKPLVKYFAAAGGSWDGKDPFDNNKFNEFIKYLKNKYKKTDFAQNLSDAFKNNNIYNNIHKNIYKTFNK